MAGFEIAQLNVGRAVGPMDGAEMADFVARLDEINALAEGSPGFVWRLQGDNGNATALHYTDDPRFIVNLSVWRSIDELWSFAYASTHKELFRRRFEWFERSETPTMVLWWQPGGTVPDIHDELLRSARRRVRSTLGVSRSATGWRLPMPTSCTTASMSRTSGCVSSQVPTGARSRSEVPTATGGGYSRSTNGNRA